MKGPKKMNKRDRCTARTNLTKIAQILIVVIAGMRTGEEITLLDVWFAFVPNLKIIYEYVCKSIESFDYCHD